MRIRARMLQSCARYAQSTLWNVTRRDAQGVGEGLRSHGTLADWETGRRRNVERLTGKQRVSL